MQAIGDHLVNSGRLRADDLARAEALGLSTGRPLDDALLTLGLISDGERAALLADHLGLPLAGPTEMAAAPDLSGEISAEFLRRSQMLPLWRDTGRLGVAMARPDEDAIEALAMATGLSVVRLLAPLGEVQAALDRIYGDGRTALERIVADIDDEQLSPEEDPERLKDLASEAPVVRLVGHLIDEAVRLRASDIHIEPFPEAISVRYRIDGVLRHMPPPPAHLVKALVSRIKILAHLNIAERRLPQDGRVGHVVQGRRLELRVSTLPTVHGESVAIRLLDGAAAARDLSSLGLAAADEAVLRRLADTPNGMVLVTGPTGSGKTTTLYAALRLIDAATRKVLTVEDPVEVQLPGITQVQVKPQIGLDFATVLRSMVRQDPDVILVGETRDAETASIAVHAALTGHLVLSTLHTNSAAGALTRLVDMGIEPFLLASTVRGIIGQRLVRMLCQNCKVPAEPDRSLAQLLTGAGLPARCNEAAGCERCGGTGFHGRIGIFELLVPDQAVRGLVTARAATAEIEAAARAAGMRGMLESGLARVAEGVTTWAEVKRVTDGW